METTKKNNKALVGIFAFCACAMANNMTMAIIAYIMQSYSNVSPTVVSQLLAIPSLIGTAFAFFVGTLNTKFNVKSLMIFVQAALFASGMMYFLLGGKAPIYVLYVAAGLVGLNQGSMMTLLSVMLSKLFDDPQKRSGVYGICTAIQNIGGVFFSVVGGALAVNGWTKAYMLYFLIIIAIIFEILFLPGGEPEGAKAPAHADAPKQNVGRMPITVYVIAIHYFFFFLWLYVYGSNVSEYIINTYKLGTSVEAGLATSLVTGGGIVAGAFFGQYSKVLKKCTVPFMMGCTIVGLGLPLFCTTNIIAVYAGGLLNGFAMSGCAPYIMAELGKVAPGPQYAKAMSIFSGFMNLGMCVAITVIAFITQLVCGDGSNMHYKFMVGFVGTIICMVTAIPIYVLRKDKEQA